VIIEAGTKIPCIETIGFANSADHQKTVNFRIAEGDSKYFEENTFIDFSD
jgi:molecular chaperone DnaK (HSP70)